MITSKRSEICLAMQDISTNITSADLKSGRKYIAKLKRNKQTLPFANWAIAITTACLNQLEPDLVQPTAKTWQSHGIRVVKTNLQEDLHQQCIGNEKKLVKIGEGFFGTAYAMEREGQKLVVKIEKLKDSRLQNLGDFIESIRATQTAGELGIGPKVHESYVCLQGRAHHFVIVMDNIKGPTWDKFAEIAAPAEMTKAAKILKEKMIKLNKAGIHHRDLINPKNIIVVLQSGKVINVVPIDYGISEFGDTHDVEKMSKWYRDDWLVGFAGHLLGKKLLDVQ